MRILARHLLSVITALILGAVMTGCLSLWPAAAHAGDPYTFTSPGCDFRITFPEKPQISQNCVPQDKREGMDDAKPGKDYCHRILDFTHVFNAAVTLRTRVTCAPAPDKALETYSGKEMEKTLEKMITSEDLQQFQTQHKDYGDYRHASLTGRTDTEESRLVIAQLWMSRNSILTLEAGMVGPQSHQADMMLAKMLRSLRPVDTLNQGAEDQGNDNQDSGSNRNQRQAPDPLQKDPPPERE